MNNKTLNDINLYDILGIEPNSEKNVVRQAYMRLAKL